MKKLFAIFMLCVFLLSSVSLALAEEGRGKNTNQDRPQERPQQEKIKERQMNDQLKLEERNLKQTFKEQREALRETLKTRKDAAKARKDEIKAAAGVLKEQCRARLTLEGNCGEAFNKIKSHLQIVVDRMIEALTALKTRAIPVPPALPDDTLQPAPVTPETLSAFEATTAKLQALKLKIDAAQTRDELKAVMREVSEAWVHFKQTFKEKQQDVYHGRARSLLTKAERTQAKLRQVLERLQASGSDIQPVEAALQAIDAQITVVKQALTQGDRGVVKLSLEKLHDLLKDAIKQFRSIGKGDAVTAVIQVQESPVAPTDDQEVVA